MRLIIENIRSFAGRFEVNIRPLTLLVGENSTGKSTILAALSALRSKSAYPIQPSFNDPPFNLGSFNTILSNVRRQKTTIPKHFTLGYRNATGRHGDIAAEARYVGNSGRVVLSRFFIRSEAGEFSCQLIEGTDYKAQLVKNGNDEQKRLDLNFQLPFRAAGTEEVPILLGSIYPQLAREQRDWQMFELLVTLMSEPTPLSIESVAPIRSKPSRTYDQVTEEYSPEGTHIPYLLARVLTDPSPSEKERSLIRIINQYGIDSGLYNSLKIKKLGESISDPFQILIKASGRPANLIDVGYGVSQVLPIITQSVLTDRPRILLLQQPEVHLHPKAQAALGSLFANLVQAGEGGYTFVIETHSDYLVDRIRQEIGQGTLDPNMVSIIFLELKKGTSRLHHLDLDRSGNLLKVPASYRQFFLQEELNLLRKASV